MKGRNVLALAALAVLAINCATSPRASTSSATSTPAPSVAVAPAASTSTVTTVILVRHAEKVDASSDPELSAAGKERAQVLVDVVRNAKVTSIITTQFRRTRATAEPAAAALGITPVVVTAGGPHASVVADSVRARSGQVILVVGHSNSVPAIIAALGGAAQPPICDSEYDDLFVLAMPGDGRAPVLVRSRYGATSTRGVGCPPMK